MVRVRCIVDDVEEAIAFYTSNLGFEIKQNFSPAIALLVLEIRDSITDAILARAVDHKMAEQAGGILMESNRVTNTSEVRRWASLLRERLDELGAPPAGRAREAGYWYQDIKTHAKGSILASTVCAAVSHARKRTGACAAELFVDVIW